MVKFDIVVMLYATGGCSARCALSDGVSDIAEVKARGDTADEAVTNARKAMAQQLMHDLKFCIVFNKVNNTARLEQPKPAELRDLSRIMDND